MNDYPEMEYMEITHPDFPRVRYIKRVKSDDRKSALNSSAQIIFGIAFKKSMVVIEGETTAEDGVEILTGTLEIFYEKFPGTIQVKRRAATLDERMAHFIGSGFIEPKGVYG
jgi:hypothetical protein